MELIFNYAILTAIPDARRGERVNVGLVVFLPSRLDVRFSDLNKLRAITGHDWTDYAKEASDRLSGMFVPDLKPHEFNRRVEDLEPVIKPTDAGWFILDQIEDYEKRVDEILLALVTRPRAVSKKSASRINSEIKKEFKKANILADSTETIEDHKVMPNFYISADEALRADFVLKNGAYHVTATLDLRHENVHIKEAAWKAVVLDRAKAVLMPKTRLLGVYAATPTAHQFKPHIQILRDYADDLYNWADLEDRQRYFRDIYDAIGFADGLGLK